MNTSWRKWSVLGWLIGLLIPTGDYAWAAEGKVESVPAQFEAMAKRTTHFALPAVLWNHQLVLATNRSGTRHKSALEQDQLLAWLRQKSGDREALMVMLNHPNPKVRTLVLGALFQREDGQDLPIMAIFLEDSAPTFPSLHEPAAITRRLPALRDIETPLTVGTVAQCMAGFYLDYPGRLTPPDFARLWQPFDGRTYAAGWFAVQAKRATHSPRFWENRFRAQLQPVLARVDALPAADRDWTRLYLLCPWVEDEFCATNPPPDDALLAAAKNLGPDALLSFLRREPPHGDPSFGWGIPDPFARVSRFILGHANELLRPTDASALLECEAREARIVPSIALWSVAAARLQPEQAEHILKPRLEHPGQTAMAGLALLAAQLWNLRGTNVCDYLADWIYRESLQSDNMSEHPARCLQVIRAHPLPESRTLANAMVRHPRFAGSDQLTVRELLLLLNRLRPTPLIMESELNAATSDCQTDWKRTLPDWRNRLRREFQLTEAPQLPPLVHPKTPRAKARFSIPLKDGIRQIAVSRDDQWLAMLSEAGELGIWNAHTGRSQGKSTLPFEQATFHLGFRASDNTLLAFGLDQVPGFKTCPIPSLRWSSSKPPGEELDLDDSCNHLLLDATGTFAVFLETRRLAAALCAKGQALWTHTNADGEFGTLALARDGHTLAATVCHVASQVRILAAHNGQTICNLNEFSGEITALALSPQGNILATATEEDGLVFWALPAGKKVMQLAYPEKEIVTAMAYSPNGQWLAVSGEPTIPGPCRVGLFKMPAGELSQEWKYAPHQMQRLPSMAFANDSKTLFIAGQKLTAWPLPKSVAK